LSSKRELLYHIADFSQVPVALAILMHGGEDAKLSQSPCAFMLNYVFSGSEISSRNTVFLHLKILFEAAGPH